METGTARRPESASKQQARVNVWNRHNAIGTQVWVRMDDGSLKASKTTSEATMLSGHTAVIMLEGIVGCFMLSRVTAARATRNRGTKWKKQTTPNSPLPSNTISSTR